MECREAQEAIFELLDGEPAAEVREHLAGCPACAAFAARQNELDRELGGLLQSPALPPDFRANLRRRIAQEPTNWWPESLPDIVHVTSCAAATALCAIVLPFGAGPVLAAGATFTVASYVLMLAARSWLDA